MEDDVAGIAECDALFKVAKRIKNRSVVLDFARVRWLEPISIAFLGGLRVLLAQQGCEIELDLSSSGKRVKSHIEHCGLELGWLISDVWSIFKSTGQVSVTAIKQHLASLTFNDEKADSSLREFLRRHSVKDTSIGFLHFAQLNAQEITGFLRDEWLKRGNFDLTPDQEEYVVSCVGELFVNGFTHSESPVGVVAFGQFFPRTRELRLVVMDLGVGIPETIRRRLEPQHRSGWLEDGKALEWAFKRGYSGTRDARGLGLDIMRQFVVNNSGTMKVYSSNGYGIVSRRSFFATRSIAFPGTAIEIALRSVNYVPPLAEIIF